MLHLNAVSCSAVSTETPPYTETQLVWLPLTSQPSCRATQCLIIDQRAVRSK